jgi:phosphoglycerol transferase
MVVIRKLVFNSSNAVESEFNLKANSTLQIFLVKRKNLLISVTSGVLSFFVPIFVSAHKYGFKLSTLSTPLFFYGDEFFGAAWVNSLLTHHSLVNPDLGWPLGQDFNYAFVSQDAAPHFAAALIAALNGSPYFGMNVYLLLTFGLVGLSFFISARILGAGNTESILLSFAVSLLPQHFSYASQALTVDSYFFIPPIFAICISQISQRRFRIGKLSEKRYLYLWLAFCFLSGTWYSYYSIGTILILFSLGLFLGIYEGSLEILKRLIPTLIAIGIGFIVVSIPSLINVSKTVGGINYYNQRSWQAAFANSGSLAQSIAPVYGTTSYRILDFFHKPWNVTFGQLKAQINSYGILQEGWNAIVSLTLIIATILAVILAAKVLRERSSRTNHGLDFSEDIRKIRLFVLVSIITLLWFWAGGFGTLFAMFVSQTLRGYSRFSVYIVICLSLAVALAFGILRKIELKRYLLIKIGLVSLLIIMTLDAFTVTVFSQPASNSVQKNEVKVLASKFPKDCKVLEFPVVHFPYESPGWPAYRLLAPSLMGDRPDLKWSAGAVGGSPAWAFIAKYRKYQDSPSTDVLRMATKDGFCAILVDTQVWDEFHKFQPVPSYQRVPAAELTDFLSVLGNDEIVMVGTDTYHIHFLK